MTRPRPPPLEREIGLEAYITSSPPAGGRLRERCEDFVVVEKLPPDLKPRSCDYERYCLYIVGKKCITTPYLLRLAGDKLKIHSRYIGYAGLKDKRSLAFQYLTVPKGKEDCRETIESEHFKARLVGCIGKNLKRGVLEANFFRIIVKEVEKPGVFEEAFRELKAYHGIPGYYGHQRFGTIRPNTHLIGRFIVRKDWEDAVRELIGKPREWESKEAKEARRAFENGFWRESLSLFPPHYNLEKTVLKKLIETGDAFRALNSLPRWMLELYIAGYQSYIFNRVLSLKLAETGFDPARALEGEIIVGEKDVDEVRRGRGLLFIPLPGIGFHRHGVKGRLSEIYKDVMEEEGVRHDYFNLKHIGVVGVSRKRLSYARTLVSQMKRLHNNVFLLLLGLPPGMYATVFVRELIKNDPIKAGF